jgi:glycosyltransferase involved in cell wall biosynthesis
MENRQQTLVILTPGFPASEADTFTPPQQVFVKALKEANPGLNIIVLAFQYPYASKIYRCYGVTVMSFGSAVGGKIHHSYTGLRVWLTLKRLNKKHLIIGLLSFWLGKCALIGSKFAKKYNLKHYTWILGQDAKSGNKYIARIRPNGANLIALSDFIKREVTRNYDIIPQHIIPVGVDTSLFKTDTNTKDIDVFGAGSLIPLKQYYVFLEVIAGLKPTFPNINAAIAGTGPQAKQLQQTIKALGLENNVTLLGWLPHTEVLAIMQRTKVFLHPSNYEGFGAVCLEALYAGAKVISFVKPMDDAIPNWHIAVNKLQMATLTQQILSDKNISHQSVLPYTIQDNVKAMIKLFEG